MPVKLEVLTGPWVGKHFYSDNQRFSVGSSGRNDFAIDSSAYREWDSFQVRFTVTPDGCWAQPLGKGLLYVNRIPANTQSKQRLRSGDVLSASPTGLQLSFEIISHLPSTTHEEPISTGLDDDRAANPIVVPLRTKSAPLLASVSCAVLGVAAIFYFLAGNRMAGQTPNTQLETAKPDALVSNQIKPSTAAIVVNSQAEPVPASVAEQRSARTTPTFSVESVRASIVWLRGDVDGLELPWCCGWVVGEHHIVTTANSADVLREVVENGGATMLFDPANETFQTVTETTLHPVFSESSTTPQTPLSPNLAILTTNARFARTLKPSTAETLSSSIIGTKIHAVGYLLPESDQLATEGFTPKPYSRFDAPKLISRTGTVKSTVGGKHLSSDCPLLVLSIEEWAGCDGSAVFDDAGRMIGTLFKHSSQEEAFVVLNDYIEAFSNHPFKVSK